MKRTIARKFFEKRFSFFFKFITLIKGIRAFVMLIRDPKRLDQVFKLSDATDSDQILNTLAREFSRDTRGKEAFQSKHRVGSIDLIKLGRLPEGTLGRVFSDHMLTLKLMPEALPTLPSITDEQFIRAHLYETHDFWHVVTGFGTDTAGELGLQAFYLAQFRGPFAPVVIAAGILNTVFFAVDESETRARLMVAGWLMGKRAQRLFGLNWNELLEVPLTHVRAELGIDIAAIETALPSDPSVISITTPTLAIG